ncbi:hypothetical protein FHL15_006827 [Xylaria flabelliformis]|uniref:Uncharacterized protein n=1 Tax=Xylaria flabelliformis TaxID=2512241 RepID=A0A553HW79_9PEZI|nr:hypothetical protein FHL15_006827 [Xylaria flabelliformis]
MSGRREPPDSSQHCSLASGVDFTSKRVLATTGSLSASALYRLIGHGRQVNMKWTLETFVYKRTSAYRCLAAPLKETSIRVDFAPSTCIQIYDRWSPEDQFPLIAQLGIMLTALWDVVAIPVKQGRGAGFKANAGTKLHSGLANYHSPCAIRAGATSFEQRRLPFSYDSNFNGTFHYRPGNIRERKTLRKSQLYTTLVQGPIYVLSEENAYRRVELQSNSI